MRPPALAILALAVALDCPAAGTNMVGRSYAVAPTVKAMFRGHGPDAGSTEAQSSELRRFFESLEIPFPEGSSIRLEGDRLVIWNTPENLDLFHRILNATGVVMNQVEIDCSFVAFPDKDLEAAARRAGRAAATTEEVRALWRSGSGRLVTTSKVVTRSGVEAQAKGVAEILHPTEFERAEARESEHERYHPAHPPGAFETRETGVVWTVIPTVGSDERTIDLIDLRPELASLPGWDDLGPSRTSDGKTAVVSLRQPRFHSRNLIASVVLWDGSTVVLGGYPDPGRKETVYVFVSARIVDPAGRPPAP